MKNTVITYYKYEEVKKKKKQNRETNRLHENNNSICGINNLTIGEINKTFCWPHI
jgi:hypothetical protein